MCSGNGETALFWRNLGREELRRARRLQPNIAVAKNVMLFLGDGMGVSTVTAARILHGQLQNKTGEESALAFENFPYIALSKTYNQNAQTADSAGTATAFLSGVKTNLGLLGMDARAVFHNCSSAPGTEVTSILHWALAAGKSVGLVTTTRITHATPAAAYAHSPDRDWESDYDMRSVAGNCTVKDIATQLVETDGIQVIFGGGRIKFLLNGTHDPEDGLITRGRLDKDLVKVWEDRQQSKGRRYKYVWNQTEFDNIDPASTDFVMGLFGSSHMQYSVDISNDPAGEPSLADMTEKAIRILSKNPKGFFLLVEGGRIDHGHHASQAVRALHDTVAFSEAVERGVALTSETDTLTVTTADHSHVFTIGGYPSRGNPIFGLADEQGKLKLATDGKPYTTLAYSNGPGAYANGVNFTRPNVTSTNTSHPNYRQQSAVHFDSETHGGEDVAIYAQGPMSHLFHGTHEQSYIAHVMAFSSCLGDYSEPSTCAQADVTALTSTACLIDDRVVWLIYLLAMVAFQL
ncbi:hypothetical protein DPMN_129498 [Dreissena polymorpha]|uniref:Alkaline phosphatase, tissue-nonspecific isozyme n=2 Tax=Dreissena polymorpha TaxID=45954 RepID=A0A9D4H5V2_DREPO|nr:hypothetical protein DPMN_129498 [Dreissena polymorpha]